MPYMPQADKRVNKKAQNYLAARKAGVKPGTRTIQADGTLGGGTKLPPRNPSIPRPNAPPVSGGGSVSPGGVSKPFNPGNVTGKPMPMPNPNRPDPRPRPPGMTPPVMPPSPMGGSGREIGGSGASIMGDYPGGSNYGRPVGGSGVMQDAMIGPDGRPIGRGPNNQFPGSGGIYGGGNGSKGAMDIGVESPGLQWQKGAPGSISPDGLSMNNGQLQPVQATPPQDPGIMHTMDFDQFGNAGGSPNYISQVQGDQMKNWLGQGNIPKRFGGDLNAAMQFMQGNPNSRMAQSFGQGRQLGGGNPMMNMLPGGMGGGGMGFNGYGGGQQNPLFNMIQ